jgi:hypothetical protein
MKTFSIHLILLTTYSIGSFGPLAGEVYYDNPFLYEAKLEGNETLSYSINTETFEGNTSSSLETIHINYDHLMSKFWAYRVKALQSEYPEALREVSFSFGKYSRTFEGNMRIYGILGTNSNSTETINYNGLPSKRFLAKGEEWITIINGESNSGITFAGIGDTSNIWFSIHQSIIKTKIVGISKISTPWGNLDSLHLTEDIITDYYFQESDSFTQLCLQVVQADCFYVKGLGLFRRQSSSNFIKTDLQENEDHFNPTNRLSLSEVPSTYHKLFKTSEQKFDSTTMTLNIQNFTEISSTQYQEILNQTKLNSWTWNGAFPWVYNSLTDSWFYYAFSGNSYNAYDARSGSWFTFDSGTGAWNPSN